MEEKDARVKNGLNILVKLEKGHRKTYLGERKVEAGDGNITNTKFLWDIHMEMIIHLLKLEARGRS